MARRWIFLFMALLARLEICLSTGRIEVHFIRYTDTCREDWNRNKCDPYFTFCLSRPQGRLSVASSACHYQRVSTNGRYNNVNNINFEHETSIRGIPNPWRVQVRKFYDPDIMLVAEAHDHDRITSNDHMHTWGVKLRETVWPSRNEAKWELRTMSANSRHKPNLIFKIRLYCDADYYGTKCDVYCKAQDSSSGHYTCDKSTGWKVCKTGWEGGNCDRDINECTSDGDICNSGSCHNTIGSFYCDCPEGHSGKYCQTIEDPCNDSPCQHGGTCFSKRGSRDYTCKCPAGWEGDDCSVRRDPCQDFPCQNRGVCESNEDKTDYRCDCFYPYNGPHCNDILSTVVTTTTTDLPTTTDYMESKTTGKLPPLVNDVSKESRPHLAAKPPELVKETTTEQIGQTQSRTQDTRHKSSSEELGMDIWMIALISGLALLVLVAVLVFFVLRHRRNKDVSMSRSSSVVFNGGELTFHDDALVFSNETFVQQPADRVPRTTRMPDGLRELPPLPYIGSTDTDADLDQGAVGGCKAGWSENGKEVHKMVSETLMRQEAGRAQPNDYADIRTLSRTMSRGRITDASDIPENHYADMTDTDDDLLDEPHYSTLDDMLGHIRSDPCPLTATLPEISTITAGGAEYVVPRDTPAETATQNTYAVPRNPSISPDYQTPRDVEVEAQAETGLRTGSGRQAASPGMMTTAGAATNPMYDHVPRKTTCDIQDIIPPTRLQ